MRKIVGSVLTEVRRPQERSSHDGVNARAEQGECPRSVRHAVPTSGRAEDEKSRRSMLGGDVVLMDGPELAKRVAAETTQKCYRCSDRTPHPTTDY